LPLPINPIRKILPPGPLKEELSKEFIIILEYFHAKKTNYSKTKDEPGMNLNSPLGVRGSAAVGVSTSRKSVNEIFISGKPLKNKDLILPFEISPLPCFDEFCPGKGIKDILRGSLPGIIRFIGALTQVLAG